MSFPRPTTRTEHMLLATCAACLALAGAPGIAHAHGTATVAGGVATAWHLDVLVIAPLVAAGWVYVAGLRALSASAGVGRGIQRWQAAAFFAGLAVLFIALVSPLDTMSLTLFSAHMTQHLLLMLAAAPLIVLGAPGIAVLWAMPMSGRRYVHRVQAWPWAARAKRALMHPATVWCIYALVFWTWHVPTLYDAALRHDGLHALEHATFLSAALLFWWTVLHTAGGRRFEHGAAALFVFTTMLQQSILAALLTLSSVAWYPHYTGVTGGWRLSAVSDQQLAGLIMWLPSNLIYLATTGALIALWLRDDERRIDAQARPRRTPTNLGDATSHSMSGASAQEEA